MFELGALSTLQAEHILKLHMLLGKLCSALLGRMMKCNLCSTFKKMRLRAI